VLLSSCHIQLLETKSLSLRLVQKSPGTPGYGDGTFAAKGNISSGGQGVVSLADGDFNGDGLTDIVVMNYSGTASVLKGNGDFTFQTPVLSGGLGDAPQGIAVADFNGDGIPDFATPQPDTGAIAMFTINTGYTATAAVSSVALAGTGQHTVSGTYSGDSNWASSTGSVAVTAQPVSTVTTLSGSPSTSLFGQSITLAATVSPTSSQGHTVNGETVTFYAGSTQLGTATLVSGTATFTTSTLAVGSYTMTAQYGGDTNFAASTSTGLGLTVAQPAITLSVTTNGSPAASVTSGSFVKLTATVTGLGSPETSGFVNFCDASATSCSDIHLLGTAHLSSSGTASILLRPRAGQLQLQAKYSPSLGNTTSSSVASLSVTTIASAVLQSSGQVGNYTLTATVSGVPEFLPTGTVSFVDLTDSNYALGSSTLGTGSTTAAFAAQTTYNTGVSPSFVATGDLNGDGIPDLAVVNSGANTLTILLGKGDGTFTNAGFVSAGTAPAAMVVGDFNGDGKQDLAIANAGSNNVSLYLGNGDGTFTFGGVIAVGTSPTSIAAVDLNGDGLLDLVVANDGSSNVTILLGNGNGTFTLKGTLPTDSFPNVAVGDFNGDGIPDLIVLSQGTNAAKTYLGNGDGTFTFKAAVPGFNIPYAVAIGDFNGDGKLDVAVTNTGSNIVTILLGNGDGTFTLNNTRTVQGAPQGIAVGDFNGDGIVDLAVDNRGSNSVMILLGAGDGSFTNAATLTTGNSPNLIATADLNGDGLSDVIVPNLSDKTAGVLLNQSASTATATVTGLALAGTGTHTLQASYTGNTSYAANAATATLNLQPLATTLSLTGSLTSSYPGQSVTLTATLSPYTAEGTSTNGETVTFYSGSTSLGNGTLSGGIATLTTTAIPQGTNTLSANYAGDTDYTAATSANLSFSVQQLTTTLSLAESTGAAYAGQPVTLTATLSPYSATGASTNGSAVTFYVNGVSLGSGTLAGGVATLTTSAVPKGSNTLIAGYAGDTRFTASTSNSVGITVTNALSQLSVTISGLPALPTKAITGQPYTVTVTALSASGTTLADFGNTVVITSTDSFATLPANSYTFQPSDAGSHTFTVRFNTAGSQTISATTGSIRGTSQSVILIGLHIWTMDGTGGVGVSNVDGTPYISLDSSGGTMYPYAGMAFDQSGDLFLGYPNAGDIDEFDSNGNPLNSAGGGPYSGVAVDGAGNVWSSFWYASSIAEFNSTLKPIATGIAATTLSTPHGIAIDSSGSLWIPNSGNGTVTQVIGVAAPVVTPLSTAVANSQLGVKP
jgi:hypothetical protein